MTNEEALKIVIDVATKRKPHNRQKLKTAVQVLAGTPEPETKTTTKAKKK